MYNATDGHGAGLQRGGNAMPGKQKGQVVNRPHGTSRNRTYIDVCLHPHVGTGHHI